MVGLPGWGIARS